MARHTEPTVNTALAAALRRRHPRWTVTSEQTDTLEDKSLRPDVMVKLGQLAPVIVEAEFAPARTVENDAYARLGLAPKESDPLIEQAIALRYSPRLREATDLDAELEAATLEWCILSGDGDVYTHGDDAVRWPPKGWNKGRVDDLARVIEQVSLAERLVTQGLKILERGVRVASYSHRKDAPRRSRRGLERAAKLLHQEAGEQTSRMAMAIIANAMIFHKTLEGMDGVEELESFRGPLGTIRQSDVIVSWYKILQINYWPIFSIARDLLRTIRMEQGVRIATILVKVAQDLAAIGVTSLTDLSGRMFQRLIADRKFLATFYTLPNSSALLAEIAIPRLRADWGDAASVQELRIGDLACGTGALLLAAYQGVLARHRHGGGDDAAIHRGMMERSLVAADIMPAATHLTASNLSGTHPGATFRTTCVYTMPYGRQPEERDLPVAIGSLDLLEDGSDTMALFGTGQGQMHGQRELEDSVDARVDVPHGCLDLAIMNPPFTRPTNHESTEVPVPSFAGFDTSADEQREMSLRLKEIGRRTKLRAGHGNAGLASYFVDLAHVKTRPGGVVALVLPASMIQGGSWKGARELLESEYKDIVVVALATTGSTDRAFSADTGMAEVLLVGTKLNPGEQADPSALFVNLLRRPESIVEAADVARAMRVVAEGSQAAQGDGDPAHDPRMGDIEVGGHKVGTFVRHRLTDGGAAGIASPELALSTMALAAGELRLQSGRRTFDLPLVPLSKLGTRGPIHRDISGRGSDGAPRGPWDIFAIDNVVEPIPSWPALWGHDAARERRLVVSPDTAGRVREGCRSLAYKRWGEAASRLHFNLDFQINSQSLAACLTPKPVIGGRAWPSFHAERDEWDVPLVLWANTTPGLIMFWWKGSRQHQGRASTTLSRLPQFPVLDPRALTADQVQDAHAIFAEFLDRAFLPANEAYRDDTRADLDRAVLCRLLGLPDDIDKALREMRDQWCAEPSVHGGKRTRIDAPAIDPQAPAVTVAAGSGR